MKSLLLVSLSLIPLCAFAQRPGRPSPPPSRYAFTVEFDQKTLPEGVSIRVLSNEQGTRYFISNASETPLFVNQRFQNDRLVTGNQLVSGRVLHYFPNGVPMEGKRHLKGWQAPFGEMKEAMLVLKDPKPIYEGRKPGLSKTLPPNEPYVVSAKFGDKPIEIKGTVHYHLNKAYDARK